MAYEYLAGCYDRFTADVPYAAWADYVERHFARCKLPIHTVLDLACGTGSLTCELAERGYEMIGADLSEEMLAQAAEKAKDAADTAKEKAADAADAAKDKADDAKKAAEDK